MKRAIPTNNIAFLWENQARQYPRYGSGITYFKGICEDSTWVDCLLYYGYDNELHGILNHYPFEILHTQRREALIYKSDLIEEEKVSQLPSLIRRLIRFNIKLEDQEYTPDGERFIKKYMRSSRIYKMTDW